jgi:hypothetical protein
MWKILTLLAMAETATALNKDTDCKDTDHDCTQATVYDVNPFTVFQSNETAEWNKNKGDDTCWVSKLNKTKASPSLRNCYGVTEQACCNFVEDVSIGDTYSSFIPSPCADDFKEI